MLPIMSFFVFFILVPTIYIAIILFDLLLIARTRTVQQRLRSLAGVLVAFLVSVIVILLDQSFGPLIKISIPSNAFEISWSSAVIALFIGFMILLGLDFLVSRGIVPFVILFTIAGVLLSAYFLLSLSEIRTTTAITTMGFLVGVILYFMIFPTRIFNAVLAKGEEKEED